MPDPRALAVDVLLAVERGPAFAKEALAPARASLADPRDRGLLTEVVYGTLRRRATLDAVLAAFSSVPVPRLDPVVRAAARAALAQALLLDRVPPAAAVGAAVETVKARTNARFAGFANAVLRNALRAIERRDVGPDEEEDPRRDLPRPGGTAVRFRRPVFPDPGADPAASLAARFAHPAWLVRRWLDRHGLATTRTMLEAGAGRPPVVLRAPPGLRGPLVEELRAAGVAAREGEGADAVVLAEGGDPGALESVREGRARVMDETSQRVAPLLGLAGGARVLDLCAAPGGKAAHALDLLAAAGGGALVACDVSEAKVAALAASLAGRPVEVRLVPERGPLPFDAASFDAVLVDAPCSNTGVLRRRVEARDRLREGDPAALALAQRALLARAAPLLRPGGRLVYATCSVEPEEGREVAEAAARDAGLAYAEGFSVLPSPAHDGGFAAVLARP